MASECRPDGPHRVSTIPDIYFGVELEITDISIRQAADVLNANGFPCSEGSWMSINRAGHWLAARDGTVHNGCEIKSPKLKGVNGLSQIATVARILKSEGEAGVDGSCGFHVHVDAENMTAIQLRRILMLWTKHGKALEWFAAPHRRDGRFSHSLNPQAWELCSKRGSLRGAIEKINRQLYLPRDCALNIHAVQKHGTIECRLHEGTLNEDIIVSWIVLLLRLVDSCREIRFGWGDGILPRNVDSLRSLMQKIGLYPAWCYYRDHSPEMSAAAKIVRRRFVDWCKAAGVDPDPKEGPDKGPGWKPRRIGA